MLDWLSRNPKTVNRELGNNEIFAKDGLSRLAEFKGYASAEPYPHLVIDNLFNSAALKSILQEWPADVEFNYEKHHDGTHVVKKVATTWKTRFGPTTRNCFVELSGPLFLKTLESVTGVWGLIPDPYMFGAGLHATSVGGKLAVHADYNKHPFFKLDRRLNLLIYLNVNWTDENAGWLELWDRDMKTCVKQVLPLFNKTVIFSTSSHSFHGQPEVIKGPPGLLRKSIALYYFSNGRADEGHPPDDSDEHSTLWQKRPNSGY